MVSKLKIWSSMKQVFSTVWHATGQLLLFSFIYQLMVTFLFWPILRFVFSFFLRMKGYPLLINADIREFFWSFSGILIGIFILVIIAITIYYEFSTILHTLKLSRNKPKSSLLYSMEKSVFSLTSLQNKDAIGFILYSIVLLPLMNFGIQSTILPQVAIPNYVIGEVTKYPGGFILLPLLTALGGCLFIRLILVLPMMIFKQEPFFPAAKRSFQTTKGNSLRIAILFGITLLLLLTLMILPLTIFMGLRGVLFLPFKGISLLLSFAISAVFPSVMMCTVLVCYEHFAPEFQIPKHDIRVEKLDSSLRKLVKGAMSWMRSLWSHLTQFFSNHAPQWLKKRPYFLILFLLIPAILLIDFVIPLQFEQDEILVIGHRGSLDGVENSVEAIEGAITQGADYAEIDILLSKDGIPMVIHDTNLNRLAGIKGGVYDYTAEELSTFVLSDREYTGKIATLDEVCNISKGRIGLLVELKSHGYEKENIVDETTAVIQKYHMEDEVMYQSANLNLISELKIKHPHTTVGYIIYGYVGNLSTGKLLSLGVDFLGVEESFTHSKLVKTSHRVGLPVYVWTINLPENVAQYHALEVDAIITDYPGVIKDALEHASNKK